MKKFNNIKRTMYGGMKKLNNIERTMYGGMNAAAQTSGASALPDGETPFFHGAIKKGAADALLSADDGLSDAGKFLIRSKGDSVTDFILSVVYKGAATHHTLVRDGEGEEFKLNKQPTGASTMADLIEKYRSKQPKWPVPLTDGVPT